MKRKYITLEQCERAYEMAKHNDTNACKFTDAAGKDWVEYRFNEWMPDNVNIRRENSNGVLEHGTLGELAIKSLTADSCALRFIDEDGATCERVWGYDSMILCVKQGSEYYGGILYVDNGVMKCVPGSLRRLEKARG